MVTTDMIFRIAGGLFVLGLLIFLIISFVPTKNVGQGTKQVRRKILNPKPLVYLAKFFGKAGKGAVKSAPKAFNGLKSKIPKLPSNGQSVINQPTTSAQKVNLEEPLYSTPETGKVIYTESCQGWQLGDELEGRSIAFKCVAGYDDRHGIWKICFYLNLTV